MMARFIARSLGRRQKKTFSKRYPRKRDGEFAVPFLVRLFRAPSPEVADTSASFSRTFARVISDPYLKTNFLLSFKVSVCIFLCAFCSFSAHKTYAQDFGRIGDSAAKKDPANHIYLSFDDGPLQGSEDVSNAVQAEKIKINVFVVGSHVRVNERMKQYFYLYESNPFIEIGNHSFSHAHDEYRAFYADPAQVYIDFRVNENILRLKNRLARLPGRNMWRLKGEVRNDVISGASSADLLFKNGYAVFGWDLELQHDSKTGAPIQTVEDMVHLIDKLLREKKTVAESHLVLLCHDAMFRKSWRETELKELIDRLRATGEFSFHHLSEYSQ